MCIRDSPNNFTNKRLPHPIRVVSSTNDFDDIAKAPTVQTRFSYAGGDFDFAERKFLGFKTVTVTSPCSCLLYTSDAADERSSVDIGGPRIIKKKTKDSIINILSTNATDQTIVVTLVCNNHNDTQPIKGV